jgi:hypothetical protein
VTGALIEDLVGELAVGEGAGQLRRPHHRGEGPDGLAASGLRIRRRQMGGDLFHDGRRVLGVRLLGGVRAAAELVEQCGGGASGAGLVTVFGGQIATPGGPWRRTLLVRGWIEWPIAAPMAEYL